MPSRMLGSKSGKYSSTDIFGGEGMLRTHLAVSGPGVPAGAVDDTLLNLADILPTMAELAGANATKHRRWSGQSFSNLLAPVRKVTRAQRGRALFTLVATIECPEVIRLMRELPDLGTNRCELLWGFAGRHQHAKNTVVLSAAMHGVARHHA
jgi:hypothetical protein